MQETVETVGIATRKNKATCKTPAPLCDLQSTALQKPARFFLTIPEKMASETLTANQERHLLRKLSTKAYNSESSCLVFFFSSSLVPLYTLYLIETPRNRISDSIFLRLFPVQRSQHHRYQRGGSHANGTGSKSCSNLLLFAQTIQKHQHAPGPDFMGAEGDRSGERLMKEAGLT